MPDQPYRGPRSDHFDGARFFNPGAAQAKGLGEVLRWKLSSRATTWPDLSHESPVFAQPPATVTGNELRATFVNHSTVLLQVAGCNLLTDPIWSERASPLPWVGPRRHRPPGVRWDDLPRIDVVLLSHNHYDHLDLPTLRRLAKEHRARIVAPLGVSAVLARHGMRDVTELDWWQRAEAPGVTCVPAQHFSARGVTDRNKTLWCGFVVETPAGQVYFAADSGFGPHFAEIRRQLGAPRLALLPIGAYKPEWFMGPVHMSPQNAVEAHRVLEAETSIAIHFGTFQLADEGDNDPVRDLQSALAAQPDLTPFLVLRNGEQWEARS